MKIKHWQGYGSVNARKVERGTMVDDYYGTLEKITIEVTGDHEYGLNCGEHDKYRVNEWLLKKFEKRPVDPYRGIIEVIIDEKKYDECLYTIFYKVK